jgi:hypothetical protein
MRRSDGDMAAADDLYEALTLESGTPQRRIERPRIVSPIRAAIRQLARSVHDVWDGNSWEPGRDWLTRVEGATGTASMNCDERRIR